MSSFKPKEVPASIDIKAKDVEVVKEAVVTITEGADTHTSKSTNNGGNPLQGSLKENNVIKIIQKEWDKEIDRLDAKKNGFKTKSGVNLDSKCLSNLRILCSEWAC